MAETPSAEIAVRRPDRDVRGAGRGSILNLVGAAVSALATFGLTILVARAVDPVAAGVFFSATSLFVLVAAVCQLGTDTGLVYFIARAMKLGTEDRIASYVRAAMRPALALSLVLAVTGFVSARSIAEIVQPDHVEASTHALRALALLVPLAALENVSLSATRGLRTMRPYALLEQVVRPGLQVVLAAAILTFTLPVDLAWSWSLPYAVVGIAAWAWWRHLSRKVRGDARVEHVDGAATEFWRFTAPRSLASMAQVAMQRLDIVLVAAIAGAPEAAVYTAATRFVVVGQLARNSVSMAVQPYLAGALTDSDRTHATHLFKTSTAWLMAVTWPLFTALLVAGDPLMRVFGRSYSAGGQVLLLLALAMLVSTLCGDVDVLLIMSGRTSTSLFNMAIAFALQLGLDLWLIPLHGLIGAAVAWATSIVVKNVLALVQVAVIFGMHPFGLGTVTVGLGSIVCFGGALVAAQTLVQNQIAAVAMGSVIGLVAYAVVLVAARRSLSLGSVLSRR